MEEAEKELPLVLTPNQYEQLRVQIELEVLNDLNQMHPSKALIISRIRKATKRLDELTSGNKAGKKEGA